MTVGLGIEIQYQSPEIHPSLRKKLQAKSSRDSRTRPSAICVENFVERKVSEYSTKFQHEPRKKTNFCWDFLPRY